MAMSGPRVVGFTQGWALPLGSFSKAHYFRRSGLGGAISLCKRREGWAGRLFEAGSFPRCKLCEQAIKFHGIAVDGAG